MVLVNEMILTKNADLSPPVWSFGFFVVLYGLILISAIYSTIFANVKLGKPGISEEVRSLVLKRHVAAIIIYTVFNLYIPATGLSVWLNGG